MYEVELLTTWQESVDSDAQACGPQASDCGPDDTYYD